MAEKEGSGRELPKWALCVAKLLPIECPLVCGYNSCLINVRVCIAPAISLFVPRCVCVCMCACLRACVCVCGCVCVLCVCN